MILSRQLNRFRRKQLRNLVHWFGKIKRAEHIFMILAAIAIGVLGAFGAIGFRYLIKFAHELFFLTDNYSVEWVKQLPFWQKILMPVSGGLFVGFIVYFLAKEVRGSGIPEVMESVAIKGGSIRPRVVLAKLLAAAATIGSGGSAGREGPIVQIGSAVGSALGQFLSVSARRLRTFVACGAAAGIAATFNAPIAGAIFAVEIILGDFAVPQFSPIVISSVVATVISRHYIGDFPAFETPQYEFVSAFEFIPYTILGVLAGLLSVLFIITLYEAQDNFEKLKIPPYFKPAIGGLIIGLIALQFPQIYGVGYESINDALWGRDVGWLLVVLIFLKIIATSATLGSGGSGGVFAPSLFIGAMLGGFIGTQFHIWYPADTAGSGAYALVGMGALVAGVTHAPITAILTIFELTNDYHIIPPLMISSIIAVLISSYIKKESIYTMKLLKKGINIFEGRDINILKGLAVKDVLKEDIERVPAGASFNQLIQTMIMSRHHEYFVTNSRDEFVGMLSISELKEFLKDENYLSGLVIAADMAHPAPAYLYPDDNLDLVMHDFGRFNIDEFPVLKSQENRQLLGSVQRKDIIDAYNREIFKWDLAGGVHSIVTAVNQDREVELTEDYKLVELDLPGNFVDKTIGELNVRARYGVEILLIRHTHNANSLIKDRPGAIPTPDYLLKAGDRLLIMGDVKSISELKNL